MIGPSGMAGAGMFPNPEIRPAREAAPANRFRNLIYLLSLAPVAASCSGEPSMPKWDQRAHCESVATVKKEGQRPYIEVRYLNPCLQDEEKGFARVQILWENASRAAKEDCVARNLKRNAEWGSGSYYDLANCLNSAQRK